MSWYQERQVQDLASMIASIKTGQFGVSLLASRVDKDSSTQLEVAADKLKLAIEILEEVKESLSEDLDDDLEDDEE